jgi:hypothetical protein
VSTALPPYTPFMKASTAILSPTSNDSRKQPLYPVGLALFGLFVLPGRRQRLSASPARVMYRVSVSSSLRETNNLSVIAE